MDLKIGRAAWCFASAQHAVVAAQRTSDQEPVDVEHVLRPSSGPRCSSLGLWRFDVMERPAVRP